MRIIANKSISFNTNTDLSKNSRFVLILFWLTILFQVTGLKFIWSIETVSRVANLFALLFMFFYAIKVVGSGYYSQKLWYYYLIPGILIFGGIFLNISLNIFSNLKLISYYGFTLPWLAYLIIPALMKKGAINTTTLWRYYYYFMLWANIFGIIEYFLLFYGLINFRVLHTPNGEFFGGFFSLLFFTRSGALSYRYYSCFLEPGTLAMFLLPAITYAFFNKKFISLLIFLAAFSLTFSLGGIISLLMLIAIILFMLLNRKKKYLSYAILTFFSALAILWISFGQSLIKQYKGKNISAIVREQSFSKTLTNFPVLIIKNPIGLKLEENTESFEKNKYYSGSNFLPGTYLQYGGIIALTGYLIFLLTSLAISLKSIKRTDLSLEEKVVFPSILVMFPFILQRPTLWESALFAFLFAPSIIRVIEKMKK